MPFAKRPARAFGHVMMAALVAVLGCPRVEAQGCGAVCGAPGTQKVKFFASAVVKNGSITISLSDPVSGRNVAVSASTSGEALVKTSTGEMGLQPEIVYPGSLTIASQPISTGSGSNANAVFKGESMCGHTLEFRKVNSGTPEPWTENLEPSWTFTAVGSTEVFQFELRIRKSESGEGGADVSTETSPPTIPEENQDTGTTVGSQPVQVLPAGFHSVMTLGEAPQTQGFNAGSLKLSGAISPSAVTLAALKVTNASGLTAPAFDVVMNGTDIRQVKTDERLADVLPLPGGGFTIFIYEAGSFVVPRQGTLPYAVTANAHSAEHRFEPVPAAGGHLGGLKTTTIRGFGTPIVTEYLSTSGNGDAWRIVEADGAQVTNFTSAFIATGTHWTRTDEMTVTRDGQPYLEIERDYRYQVRREAPVGGGAAVVVESHLFLLQERQATGVPNEPDLVTTYDPDPVLLGQPRWVVRSDGSWEAYRYYNLQAPGLSWNGKLKEVLRPWNGQPVDPAVANAANSEVTTVTYVPGGSQGTELGEEVTTVPVAGVIRKETPASGIVTLSQLNPILIAAGLHAEWLPGITTLDESSRYIWASISEKLSTSRISYVRGTGPRRPWTGASAASFDGELNGTITGYELGTYLGGVFTPNTVANGGNGNHVRSISVEVKGVPNPTTSVLEPQLPLLDESTKTETVEDRYGNMLRQEMFIRTGADTWSSATATTYEYVLWPDGAVKKVTKLRDGRIVHSKEQAEDFGYSIIDEQGLSTYEYWDLLGRIVTRVRSGGQRSYFASYAGRTTTHNDYLETFLLTLQTEDLAGRVVSETNPTGAITTTSYPNGGRDTSVTMPGGVTRLTTGSIDGRTQSVTGSGVVHQHYSHEALAGGNLQTTAKTGSLANSPRYIKTITDWAGRTLSRISPNPAGGADIVQSTTYSPGTGRVTGSSSSAANVAPLVVFRPDPLSSLRLQGYDIDGGGLSAASLDRVTETRQYYESDGGLWWQVSVSKNYGVDGSAASAITTVSKRRLSGNNGGFADVSIQISPGGEVVTTMVAIDLPNKTRVQTVTRTGSNLPAVTTTIEAHTVRATSHVSVQPATFAYSDGRLVREVSPTGAVSQTVYNEIGQVQSTIDPFGKVTSYSYHLPTHQAAGRVATITNPDLKTVTYTYSDRGEVLEIGGTAEYRQTFTYDAYGERETLSTWRGASADTTTWVFDPGTGLLVEKRDAAGEPTVYLYYPSGRLQYRQWARGVGTDYFYNAYGDLTAIDYSDNTPDVSFPVLDRLGRPLTTGQTGVGSEAITYHEGIGGQMSRSYLSDHVLLAGHGVLYDAPRPDGQPTGVSEAQSYFPYTSNPTLTQYTYDGRGRLNGVQGTGRSQGYSYHPLHSRIEAIEWSGASGIQFKERRNYDVAGRLLAIHSDATSGGVATPVTRYGYEFDNLGRRKKAVLVDGSAWDYGYNDRGEVTSAARKNAAGTTIPALGATYAYDGIGNRTSSTSPVLGDRSYFPNALNQYESITTAATRTVVGRAPVADAVSVNGTTLGGAHRTGDVFHFTLPAAANANSPVWQPATVVSQGNTIARAFYHPKAVTAPQHDLDGNLENDGRWVYSWDAENRLIQMESTAAAVQAGAPYRKLVFHYDAGGRRLAKTVYHGTAAAPVFDSSTRWLYDGWNPTSEFSGTADTGGTITRTKSYTWGPDLSGTPQGAGGVGGLLAVIVHSGFTNSAYYPSYDGNGNIVAWTLEGTPAPVSRREYDAFGNTLVEQGVAPSAYGFSTKMQDAETGLYYYGYRFYDPVTGRWPSRDPIEEEGGINLYGFVGNHGINNYDILGMSFADSICSIAKELKSVAGSYTFSPGVVTVQVRLEKSEVSSFGDFSVTLDGTVSKSIWDFLPGLRETAGRIVGPWVNGVIGFKAGGELKCCNDAATGGSVSLGAFGAMNIGAGPYAPPNWDPIKKVRLPGDPSSQPNQRQAGPFIFAQIEGTVTWSSPDWKPQGGVYWWGAAGFNAWGISYEYFNQPKTLLWPKGGNN